MADDSATMRADSRASNKTLARYTARDYAVVNVLVWAVLAVLGAVTYLLIDRAPVVPYLMFVVGGGFTVVSVYDYLYDRLARKSDEQDEVTS